MIWYGSFAVRVVSNMLKAVKFYTRISKTYRKDRWDELLTATLDRILSCSTNLGLVDVSIETLLELMALSSSPRDSNAHFEAVTALLNTSTDKLYTRTPKLSQPPSLVIETRPEDHTPFVVVPAGSDALCVRVSMDDITPLIQCRAQFSLEASVPGSDEPPAMFQVSLFPGGNSFPTHAWKFLESCRVLVFFSDPGCNHCFRILRGRPGGVGVRGSAVCLLDAGDRAPRTSIDLPWLDSGSAEFLFKEFSLDDGFSGLQTLVLQGYVGSGAVPQDLKVLSVSIVPDPIGGDGPSADGNSFSMDFAISDRPRTGAGAYYTLLRRVWWDVVGTLGDDSSVYAVSRRYLDGVGENPVLKYILR